MQKSGLTGSRIRERRLQLGLRQSGLATTVGISPTYLNLIEHNKRRIGGKLLNDLSRELGVEASVLAKGAERTLIDAVHAAGTSPIGRAIERLEDVDDIAARFPGWADLIVQQNRRIAVLEQTAAALTDRLTHDPQLAASLHEMLSVVTAIRSTSAILADSRDINPDWLTRFHRNLSEDSKRLAENSQALVEYLDGAGEGDSGLTLPQEELEEWLEAQNFHIAAIEEGALPETVMNNVSGSPAGQVMVLAYLQQYAKDVNAMPLEAFRKAISRAGIDPAVLAAEFECELPAVFRRLASIELPEGHARIGLAQCDGSGTLTFRKSVEGFALPRFGAACPLWPLYQSLSRPMSPIRQVVEQSGHTPRRFTTYAIAHPLNATGFNVPQVFQATMLIVSEESKDESALEIGASCRICPRDGCVVRREPSILTDGF